MSSINGQHSALNACTQLLRQQDAHVVAVIETQYMQQAVRAVCTREYTSLPLVLLCSIVLTTLNEYATTVWQHCSYLTQHNSVASSNCNTLNITVSNR
jgi:uncharacterized membrane protein affecting hemolysin expression